MIALSSTRVECKGHERSGNQFFFNDVRNLQCITLFIPVIRNGYFSHPHLLMAKFHSNPMNKTLFLFQPEHRIPRLLASLAFTVVFALIQLNASAQNCGPTKSSILYYALLGHAYNTSVVQEYPSCMRRCMEDAQCASCNYDLVSKQCELSSSTRAKAPDKFMKKDYSIYAEMLT